MLKGFGAEYMFREIVLSVGYTCGRDMFDVPHLLKVLKADHYGQKRLKSALLSISKDLNREISPQDISSSSLQDFALGLDYILLVPNYGKNLLYGIDITTNLEKVEEKLSHQKSCRNVYNQLGIGPTGVVYLNCGDIGWKSLSPETKENLSNQFFDLLFSLEDASNPTSFHFLF